jgi:ATP-dependent RNA helicase DDX60
MTGEHPYVKALRRGFGLYVDDSHTQEYRRIVQGLAQQGKLAVVFSDSSLAYGVNMPFRTSTFVGDDPELLTPLMAAQMSGRAGRRGLDEQGNLVYLGMPWDRVKVLMLGCIPAIRGREPRYPTMALQHVLSQFYNHHSVDKSDRVRFFPEYINEVCVWCGERVCVGVLGVLGGG